VHAYSLAIAVPAGDYPPVLLNIVCTLGPKRLDVKGVYALGEI
jgi:hypothetical protein